MAERNEILHSLSKTQLAAALEKTLQMQKLEGN